MGSRTVQVCLPRNEKDTWVLQASQKNKERDCKILGGGTSDGKPEKEWKAAFLRAGCEQGQQKRALQGGRESKIA